MFDGHGGSAAAESASRYRFNINIVAIIRNLQHRYQEFNYHHGVNAMSVIDICFFLTLLSGLVC